MAISKHKQDILDQIKLMDNRTLLDEVLSLAGGDDYDIGCFTKFGRWHYDALNSELESRLGDWLEK